MIRHLFFCCFFIFLFSSCVPTEVKTNPAGSDFNTMSFEELQKKSLVPEWFFVPSPGNIIGSLGFSRTATIGYKPEFFARKYAMEGLLSYFDIVADDKNQSYADLLNGKTDSINLQGKTFSIANILKCQDYVIARAVFGLDSQKNTPLDNNIVSTTKCLPKWLCSPASGSLGGVLGLSYRAVSPQRQYELAVKNGLLLLKYSYGVDVSGQEEIRRVRSGTGVIRLRRNNLSLKMLGNVDSIRLYVKETRYIGETLYLWLVSPDLPSFDSDDSWKYGILKKGSVGECGLTASGLLSDQIKLSVEKAVLSMAKNKELGLDVSEFVSKGTFSSVFDQVITSSVNTKVFPSLRGFHLNSENRVKVWMVPAK